MVMRICGTLLGDGRLGCQRQCRHALARSRTLRVEVLDHGRGQGGPSCHCVPNARGRLLNG